ncbi:ABC transporter permease [Agrococcus sp. Marseille-P2731]|uniref:ABC transporter permease n=1 Tax=Agrococcus sp. Marseille-P2731 TaxID=1841862 RepID=UPI000A626D36|nr:ABC transporter permease [Agrococcus sp. Marseille-P2731]
MTNSAKTTTQEEVAGQSQSRLIFTRFVSNKSSMVSLVLLVAIFVFAISAIGIGPIPGWWHYDYRTPSTVVDGGRPTLSLIPEWLGGAGLFLGDHPFGQNRIGVDYFAQTMRGVQNSFVVIVLLAGVATIVGTVVGAVAGYYRGWVDAILMRITDVFIVIPLIVVGAVVGAMTGGLGVQYLAVFLGLVAWMGIARLVRAEFLSLREREFVEAARVAGANDFRIIFKHILPNAMGVVIVAASLIAAAAIILEASLSYLGYGILPPDTSLGRQVSDNQSAFATRPWLFWFPAFFIVTPALLINFIGDGLRDAFDPRQKRFSVRRTKEQPVAAESRA